MRKVGIVIASVLIVCTSAVGQSSSVPESGPNFMYWQQAPAPGPETALPPPDVFFHSQKIGDNVAFRTGFFGITDEGKPVTGAPYSATATTESTQVLADGNRIVNKMTAFLARDSQGRTRREETVGSIGPLAVNAPKMAFITDPVSKTDYILDLSDQSARVIKIGNLAMGKRVVASGPANNVQKNIMISVDSAGGAEQRVEQRVVVLNHGGDAAQVKTESLGTQVIEGVTAEGKRVTRTIPAGQIGNERPLEITSEVWTSPELQAVVLSKRNDPRFGETVYRLTDIKRAEPDALLFQVPGSFSIQNAGK